MATDRRQQDVSLHVSWLQVDAVSCCPLSLVFKYSWHLIPKVAATTPVIGTFISMR
jgi:hypothetical protein